MDELLSGDEILTLAEQDLKQKETHFRSLVFGLLDCSTAMFFFLPFFGQKIEDTIHEVSLLSLTETASYLKSAYFITIISMIVWGILTLALQNCHRALWVWSKSKLSFLLNGAGVLLFTVSLQPYAATFLFAFLVIKVLVTKKQ